MAKYSKAFWTANAAEMLERMAYYAVFIVITLYSIMMKMILQL